MFSRGPKEETIILPAFSEERVSEGFEILPMLSAPEYHTFRLKVIPHAEPICADFM